jgi:hypothetical protein
VPCPPHPHPSPPRSRASTNSEPSGTPPAGHVNTFLFLGKIISDELTNRRARQSHVSPTLMLLWTSNPKVHGGKITTPHARTRAQLAATVRVEFLHCLPIQSRNTGTFPCHAFVVLYPTGTCQQLLGSTISPSTMTGCQHESFPKSDRPRIPCPTSGL